MDGITARTVRDDCLLNGFSHILGCMPSELSEEIGHTGSKVLATSPTGRPLAAGFHPQELVDAALRRGYAVTFLECYPVSRLSMHDTQEHPIYFPPSNEARFEARIKASRIGIIGGVNRRRLGHAFIYDNGVVIDPKDGKSFPFSLENVQEAGTRPMWFWRFDKVGSKPADSVIPESQEAPRGVAIAA